MTWNHNEDPTVMHGGECTMCGRYVADNYDLDDGLCEHCAEEMENDDEEV